VFFSIKKNPPKIMPWVSDPKDHSWHASSSFSKRVRNFFHHKRLDAIIMKTTTPDGTVLHDRGIIQPLKGNII
jgi:hypothetical protein